MKNNNKESIFREIGRILAKFILSTCVSILLIYLLIGDDEVFEILFSSDKVVEIILMFSLVWFFGSIVGALIASVEFINILAKKNVQLKDTQFEISKLQKKLNKISKKSSNSFADRMFNEIAVVDGIENDDSNSINTDFRTLQEELKANQ